VGKVEIKIADDEGLETRMAERKRKRDIDDEAPEPLEPVQEQNGAIIEPAAVVLAEPVAEQKVDVAAEESSSSDSDSSEDEEEEEEDEETKASKQALAKAAEEYDARMKAAEARKAYWAAHWAEQKVKQAERDRWWAEWMDKWVDMNRKISGNPKKDHYL
jgi:type IV secretory pathway VirB10-like protein